MYKNTYHRDETVTYWDVYRQSYHRQPAEEIRDEVLASMTAPERRRIALMAARAERAECLECGHRYPTLQDASDASWSDDGCPGCGSNDVDW